MKHLFVLVCFVFNLVSCISELKNEADIIVDFESIDSPTTPLNPNSKIYMDGIFKVSRGKELFGDEVVGKWIDKRWCFYAVHDVVYSETAGGISGDSIKLTGYVRTVRSGSGTRVKFKVLTTDGAREIISGTNPLALKITGIAEDGTEIILNKTRELHKSSFHLLAHRGGGRNSERLGVSENSVAMIEYAQILGATGIEIDVKRTRDDQLIIFHDDTFSPRTVQGAYLLGKVEHFDLRQIKMYGSLIYGEPIPTLAEALDAVIEKTELSLIWLDIKDPSTVQNAIIAQQEAIAHANQRNRNLTILLGIPTQEVLDVYDSSDLANTTPILIEFSSVKALSHPTCKAWAPRWTNNITEGEIASMHSAGKLVFTWTIDVREGIENFLHRVDGILSDYPSLVAGLNYSQE